MDPNHTHFILVDDGSVGEFGKEIEFRSRLEEELRKGKYEEIPFKESSFKTDDLEKNNSNIPIILIVVQGGKNTLYTVKENIEKDIPILILSVIRTLKYIQILFQFLSIFLKESKGCADLITNAYNSSENEFVLILINKFYLIFVSKSDQTLIKLLKQSGMVRDNNENKLIKALGHLKIILRKKHLINVFRLENDQDFEMTILRALLNRKYDINFFESCSKCD